jgi:hypothetical protein
MDPKYSIQTNFNKELKGTPSRYYEQLKNLAFQNLCTSNKLSAGNRELLGLNLKFCLASRQLQNNLNHTCLKIAYTIRTKHYLQTNNVKDSHEFIKQLYIRNKHWNPPPASTLIEEKLTEFEKLLKNEHNARI